MKFKKKINDDDQYKNLKIGKLNFKECFEEILFFKDCINKFKESSSCQKENIFKNSCLKRQFDKHVNHFLNNGVFYNDINIIYNFDDIEKYFEIQTHRLPNFIFEEEK